MYEISRVAQDGFLPGWTVSWVTPTTRSHVPMRRGASNCHRMFKGVEAICSIYAELRSPECKNRTLLEFTLMISPMA